MSESPSTRTKTVTESVSSDTDEEYLIPDRWTSNIGYRQLVVSSCIGITQLWWQPYVYDLTKLLPFLFLYNLFSIFVSYPLFTLELALGIVTKKGVLTCWDISPIARGVGVSMLITCLMSVLALSAVAAWCLAMVVHSFHSFLPWLHCAAAAVPACAARHRALPDTSEIPPHSFFFNLVLNLKREGLQGGFGDVVWQLTIYMVITWVLIYCIAVKRIYSYSKLVLFKDVLTYFVLICSAVGAVRLDGAANMFYMCDWSVLYDVQIWCEALEYSLIQMTVSQGSLIMLGSYCPKKQHFLSSTAMLSFVTSKVTCLCSAFTLGAVHGALIKDYQSNNTYIWKGSSTSMVIWSDYVSRIPGSQFWSILLFFTMFVLALSSSALLVQTIMSTFSGRIARKMSCAFLVLLCFLLCLISVMTMCTQGGMYIVNFLMSWPASKPRLLVAAVSTLTITYLYGQAAFCEDVFFAVEEYPCVLHRVCWALSPAVLAVLFVLGMGGPTAPLAIGSILVWIMVLPIAVVWVLYCIFKCRVRNIIDNEK